MVDVSAKPSQLRTAKAEGFIALEAATIALIEENRMKKGDVLSTAELAGIQAAKRTSELIPLCHPLQLTNVSVTARLEEGGVSVTSSVSCIGQTGVEMEALCAVGISLLTVYDMCKAADKSMRIENVVLLEKKKSG
jgi:cyclic pyranopterin phosphate synthase